MTLSTKVMLSAVCAICLACPAAHATTSDTFRCPNGALIATGDRLSTAIVRCDAPTVISRRTVTRGLPFGYYETVDLEEWTYNLGPSSFMYYLTFENGFLQRIESGSYGN